MFLAETYLWAYLPWIPLLVMASWAAIRSKASFFRLPGGWVAPFGFVLLFIAMSNSQYKLPHYIYIVWPFAAVWLSAWFVRLENKGLPQKVLAALSMVLFAFSTTVLFHFSQADVWSGSLLTLIFVLLAWFYWKSTDVDLKLFGPVSMAILYFGMVANFWFYPLLLTYQASSEGGKLLQSVPARQACFYFQLQNESTHALHFYARRVVPVLTDLTSLQPNKETFVYTTKSGLESLRAAGLKPLIIKVLPYYKVTHLSARFLRPSTREETLEKHYILSVSP